MPYNRPYAGGFVDYPSTTTPINANALNTIDVGVKTANDQFQTVTTAQRTALTPTVGQAVWDSDLRQLMVYMNASGGNAWQPVGNTIVCTSTSRPLTPFEGQRIYETDTDKSYVYNGSAFVQYGEQPILTTAQRDALGAVTAGTMIYNSTVGALQVYTGSVWQSLYQNRYARFKRSAGDLTLNSTAWADLTTIGTSGDLTVNAATGDVVEVALSSLWGNEAVEGFLDFVTVVGGVVTNSFGVDGAPSATHAGVLAYRGIASRFDSIGGNYFRTLAAGDISSGTVTVRVRYRTGTAANKTLYAGTNGGLEYWVRNHGPIA